MRELRNTKIIAVDHGYGNMKTANHAATIIRWARQDHPVSRQRNYESEEYETL